MDYNAIWQGLTRVDENTYSIEQGFYTYMDLAHTSTHILTLPTTVESMKRQHWVSIKEQLEVIRDDLDNIHCDIESEDHRYDYSDWDTITCNIRNMQTYIDKIKEILAKYIKEENG